MRLFMLVLCLLLADLQFSRAETFSVEEVTLSVTHRIYKDFHEIHSVKLGERLQLSDSEYSAEATEFYPDFAINADTKEVISRSDEPNNPAVRIIVYRNDEKVDEVWAFKGGGAPHYYRDSLLAFQLMDFKGFSVSPPDSGKGAPGTEIPAETGVDTGTDSTTAPSPGETNQ